MDAITMLRNDHKAVEKLFKQFEKTAADAADERKAIADQVVAALSKHAVVEEQAFYPAVRDALPDAKSTVLEAIEEHHVMKVLLGEIAAMQPGEERFAPKFTVLTESVRHHVQEEEQELFPEVRKALGRKALQELGTVMEQALAAAPAQPPSPQAPDEPPGNLTPRTRRVADRARRAVASDGARAGKRTRTRTA